jgi:bacterioferritin
MKHADKADRAHPVPRGLPNLQNLASFCSARRSRNCSSAISSSTDGADLKTAIAHCEKLGDYISRELLEDILEVREDHIDFSRRSRADQSRRIAELLPVADEAGRRF